VHIQTKDYGGIDLRICTENIKHWRIAADLNSERSDEMKCPVCCSMIDELNHGATIDRTPSIAQLSDSENATGLPRFLERRLCRH